MSVAALFAAAALAAPSTHVVDQTWSCPVLEEGAAHVVGFAGTVATPRAPASFQFWPTPQNFDQPAVQAGVDVQTRPPGITWDPRHVCTRSRAEPALGPHGLPRESVVTTSFVGSQYATCRSETRIVFRARVTLRGSRPTRAQVVALGARSRRPLGYLDWTPARIVSWLDPRCHASA